MSPSIRRSKLAIFNPTRYQFAAFTLIELLAVVAIISLMVAATLPVIKSLTKSNDQKQAANLARSMIASARNYALSQHRQAGVVFFEETGISKSQGQTAMQLVVEDYNQTIATHPNLVVGTTVFISASPRQYLPGSIKVAALNDYSNLQFDSTTARAVLFDSNGQMLVRGNLGSDPSYSASAASDADWHFISTFNPAGTAFSSPGFFLYSKAEFTAANVNFPDDTARINWLKNNADIIILNVYTGTVIR